MQVKTINLIDNRKAQINAKINAVIGAIITVVVLFTLFSNLVPEAQTAGNQLGDSQRCSDAGGNFNTTQSLCLNGTNPADTAQVSFQSIPVSTLFGSSGVVILLLMVALLIIVLKTVLPSKKK